MNRNRAQVRTLTAIVAVLALFISAPLHAAHGHEQDSLASRLHAPCAVCQFHAPSAAPLVPACDVLAPSGECAIHAPAPETLPCPIRPTPDGCRAPPAFVAI